jgi:hypothetical protein
VRETGEEVDSLQAVSFAANAFESGWVEHVDLSLQPTEPICHSNTSKAAKRGMKRMRTDMVSLSRSG